MNISPFNYTSPVFKGYDRTVKDENNFIVHRNTTRMYRQDICWQDFADFLEDYFHGQNQVKVYSFACSDGSEPYSLVTALKSRTSNPNKFFPVMASDYDSEIIKQAKKGRYELSASEFDSMRKVTNNSWGNYFNLIDSRTIEPNGKTKSCVQFKTEDIMDGLDSLQKGPKVIMARNFWPYLKGGDKEAVIKKLKEKMDKDSILVIGAFDQDEIKFDRELISRGFKEVEYTDYDDWIAFEPHLVWKLAS